MSRVVIPRECNDCTKPAHCLRHGHGSNEPFRSRGISISTGIHRAVDPWSLSSTSNHYKNPRSRVRPDSSTHSPADGSARSATNAPAPPWSNQFNRPSAPTIGRPRLHRVLDQRIQRLSRKRLHHLASRRLLPTPKMLGPRSTNHSSCPQNGWSDDGPPLTYPDGITPFSCGPNRR